jgi:hypothetical protein
MSTLHLAKDTHHDRSAMAERLDVSAQILNFEPGLYSVEVFAQKVMRGASGMLVPCIRLDPIPSPHGPCAFVSALTGSCLVDPEAPPAYLRVAGGTASVLLTIYKMAGGMVAPELRISLVQPPNGPRAENKAAASLPSEPLRLLAHIERAGDITGTGGDWVGQPGSRGALEGFAVTPSGEVRPEDIEYQAILGSDWTTPWLAGGEFCGSRGLSLPLLGVRMRLRGDAAKTHQCTYWGSFAGVGEIGPATDGAACANGGATLEALRVVLSRRATTPQPRPTAPAPRPGEAGQKPKLPAAAGKTAPPPAKAAAKSAKPAAARSLSSIRATLTRK